MGHLTTGQKVDRVMRLLLGLRHQRIASVLVHHGFTQDELDRGWALLRATVGERLSPATVVNQPKPETIVALDAFENRWFPIAQATLMHRYPAVGERLFANLSQTTEPEVAISVGTSVGRVRELPSTADGKAAYDLLAQRGLDDAMLATAESLLRDELGTVEKLSPKSVAERETALVAAEGSMWAWYLEWSTIARTVIQDGRLLQLLGFRRGRRGVVEDAGDDNNDVEVPTETESPSGGAVA